MACRLLLLNIKNEGLYTYITGLYHLVYMIFTSATHVIVVT
jgi:hypothetical protein